MPCVAKSRLVAVHNFPRTLSDNVSRLGQYFVYIVELPRRNKQEYPVLAAPVAGKVGIVQKDVRRIGEGRSKPHGSRSSVNQINRPLQIKQQRRSVSLIAKIGRAHV